METNKSVKRALSLVLAMAMLVGSLFTANIGINTKVEAAAGTVLYWDGSKDTTLADNGETGADWEHAIIIDSAAELAQLALSEGNATDGKYYKMANGIGKIVLQNEAHAAEILAIANADQAATRLGGYSDAQNWNGTARFQGFFDGNGVEIYGLYSKSTTSAALFPFVDTVTGIQNLAIRNSYIESDGSTNTTSDYGVGALIGNANAASEAAGGNVTVEKVEISNCYVKSTHSSYKYRAGVMIGYASRGYVGLLYNNCLVYGNRALHVYNDTTTVAGLFGEFSSWYSPAEGEASPNFKFQNSIILDCVPYCVDTSNEQAEKPVCYTNIYTNCVDPAPVAWGLSWSAGKIIAISAEDAKGSTGKMSLDLDWSTDETDAVWYAIEDAYPTLFKPAGWQDVKLPVIWDGTTAASFAGGSGTEADPYLIETPDQLYKMVVDGGKTNGEKTYYKVKDGVKNLYLSSALSGGYSAVKTLAGGTEGTDYHNWNTDSPVVFVGSFDGNGVTIRGMISKSTANNSDVGLVNIFGNKAVFKNVNFDTCMVKNAAARRAALIASDVVPLSDDNNDNVKDEGGAKDGYNLIYNVSVRNSSITSSDNLACAGLISIWEDHPDMLQMVNCLYDGYSCELGVEARKYYAGMASYQWNVNNFQASGCVSLGAPIATNIEGSTAYNDYSTGAKSNHPVYLYNCYTDVDEVVDTTVVELVDAEGNSVITDDYDYVANMPLLDWANGWQVISDNGRNVPMPQVRTAADIPATWDTGEVVLDYNRLLGIRNGNTPKRPYKGTYGYFEQLKGSGTESDPYLISTAAELASVVGAGGKFLSNKCYFKLTCDIDVSGMPWVNTVGARPTGGGDEGDTFTYVPFEGTLDGDGHAVIGLYAVNGNEAELRGYDWKAGLIPELNGGTIKNLHIRNSYAGTGNSSTETKTTGILVGNFVSGTIEGCSVENSYVAGGKLAGNGTATIKNSYIVNGTDQNHTTSTYYNAGGTQVTAAEIDVANNSTVWYIGAKDGAKPKLLNRAQTMTCVDADGDGIGDEYGAGDLVAIRSKLLRKTAYKNVYADANHDGNTNITDLVIMRRYVINDYNKTADGFWRNVELGNIGIYYTVNDTQDMARTLELYFKSLYGTNSITGTEIARKYAGSAVTDSSVQNRYDTLPTENCVRIVKTYDANNYDKYSVELKENNVLEITGNSFTAVEQAVIDFINESNPATGVTAQFTNRSILDLKTTDQKITLTEDSNEKMVAETKSEESSYKAKKTIDGVDYYYAWGDEFDGSNTTFSSTTWDLEPYRSEGSSTTGAYQNMETANHDALSDLWQVNDGRLTIWRGVNTDNATINATASSVYEWGYKGVSMGTSGKNDWTQNMDSEDAYVDPGVITTQKGMLFKHGYIEMEASLPSDGHAFPAWWFLTYNGSTQNSRIDNSLYSKVFRLNNGASGWNGADDIVASDSQTYKYQLPAAHLELDIIEPMQTQSGKKTTAYKYTSYSNYVDTYKHYKRDFNLTVHKIYNENVAGDYIYNYTWNPDGGVTATNTSLTSAFTTTSEGAYIHRYDFKKYGGYTVGGSWIGSDYYGAYNMNRDMTATVKYGFAWTANEKDGTYSVTIYINGVKAAAGSYCDKDMVINESTAHDFIAIGNDPILGDEDNRNTKADAAIWNQYAYMLLDNSFYTAASDATAGNIFTDLLSQDESGYTTNTTFKKDNYKIDDKATFEINYVRVYQQDGRRDIVTRDTENFNNGNHFGY